MTANPMSPGPVCVDIDEAALAVARRFTLDTEPQRRARLQVAIGEAIRAVIGRDAAIVACTACESPSCTGCGNVRR